MIKENKLLGEFELDYINERLGRLKGGLCIIKAAGLQQVEI